MPGKYSRDKGKRGELDLVHRLGGSAKRVGHSFAKTAVDVETKFAVYQVKNRTIGGAGIALQLALLPGGKDKYVAFKVKRRWYIVETLEQHIDDHGE